jgi:rubredoxin
VIEPAVDHLTAIHPPELAARIAATVPGQAHWADLNSPFVCRECRHWKPRRRTIVRMIDDRPVRVRREVLPYDPNGVLRPRRCALYRRFARADGPLVPHEAIACGYFQMVDGEPLKPAITPDKGNEHLWRLHAEPNDGELVTED